MPSKTPRAYRIHHGRHVLERQAERDIMLAIVEDTVRNGTERPLSGRGNRGGAFRRYEKWHGVRKIIVIAELVGHDCHLITIYEEGPDISRN
jgi:hypothetical protein